MSLALGIDTSNYTTSVAAYDTETGVMLKHGKLLPVKEGQLGLRQSDALFHHVQQLPEMSAILAEELGGRTPDVVGVSTRPRPVEGSYMPCFEAGRSLAEQLGAYLNIPVHRFSHQEGHIRAALYSAALTRGEPLDMGERFVAFHVSGGTTEAVMVTVRDGAENGYDIEYLCGSLDLKAGQAVDRTAALLGLGFPGGKELDRLSLEWPEDIKVRPTMRGLDCSLSGIENKSQKLLSEGRESAYIARYCLCSLAAALLGMHDAIMEKYGRLPVIFAGGVSSNTIIRRILTEKTQAVFAQPEYSCDNAAGIALLAAERHTRRE